MENDDVASDDDLGGGGGDDRGIDDADGDWEMAQGLLLCLSVLVLLYAHVSFFF